MTPIRFGAFEVDAQSGELRRDGKKVKIQEQPFQVLILLLERPGEVLTREELTKRLWSDQTNVDFERGLNKAITRLREALRDSAENPRYVETLPRRGYRFIAHVTNGAHVAEVETKSIEVPLTESRTRSPRMAMLASLVAILLIVGIVASWRWTVKTTRVPKVLGFRQLTNDGQAKRGPLVADGPRIYFNEVLPGPRNMVFQVSIRGGEAAPLAIQLKQPTVVDASEDGTELLLANSEADGDSIWIQPVSAGSPRRVGTVLAHDAAFGPNESNVIYGRGTEVYSINLDGNGLRKVPTAGHIAFGFRYSPDARALRYTVFDVQLDDMSIVESTADGSKFGKILGGCCGRWTVDGRYFVFQSRRDGRLDFWTLPENKAFVWGTHRGKPTQLTAGPLGACRREFRAEVQGMGLSTSMLRLLR
jgi:DNA-binding winged helix-turn-helix (wHTH) protein